jgi:hypothetical protein
MFNATYNNISAISWQSALLVEGIIKSTQRAPPTRELFQLLKYRKKYIL